MDDLIHRLEARRDTCPYDGRYAEGWVDGIDAVIAEVLAAADDLPALPDLGGSLVGEALVSLSPFAHRIRERFGRSS